MGLGIARNTRSTGAGKRWVIRLCALLMLLGMSFGAYAQSVKCSDFGGVLDGSLPGAVNPSQLEVDTLVCIVRNYPRSAYPPDGFIANLQYKPGQEKLVIFDNVYWSGNIACNDVQDNKIWFVNSDVPRFREDCQNVLIPVESINKRGPDFAAVGVPFNYRMLIPVLIDPQTGAVVLNGESKDDLHGRAPASTSALSARRACVGARTCRARRWARRSVQTSSSTRTDWSSSTSRRASSCPRAGALRST
jgi:hypothetical protein